MISARFVCDATWTTNIRTEPSRTSRTNRSPHQWNDLARTQCYRAWLTRRDLRIKASLAQASVGHVCRECYVAWPGRPEYR